MTTETKTLVSPVSRGSAAVNFTKSTDATKSFTSGCGALLFVDARDCVGDVTITMSTRAAPDSGRSTDPAAYNPITVGKGTMEVLGPYSPLLYGQGSAYTDMECTVAVAVADLDEPSNLAAAAAASGGTLADATYYYSVTAFNANGETKWSTQDSDTVAGGGGSGSVVLTWDAVAGAKAYGIYGRAATGAAKRHLITILAEDTPTWTDTGAYAESTVAEPGSNTATDSVSLVQTAAVWPTGAQ
jgi:hypothetical protein